jgi:signal transduction histidine kinase
MTRRALASIVGVAVVALALFGVPLAVAVRDMTQKRELLELERTATRQSSRISPENLARTRVVDFVRVEPEMHVGVYDAASRRIGGTGPARLEPELSSALRGDSPRAQGASSVVGVPIVSNGHVIGVTRVAEARSDVDRQVWKAWSFIGLLGLGVLLVTALLAYWQSRRLARPLTRLAAASAQLGEGDFTVRNEPSGIAEIDAVGSALDVTAARLGDALERERSFSADASHQLRTPLTSLRLTLERAERRPDADHELLADAVAQVDKLDGTITQLLSLARDTHHDRAVLEPQELLTEVEMKWGRELSRSGRALRVTVDDSAPTVHTSRTAVLHVLDTLLDNAVIHGAGTVDVRARATRGALTIEVGDEGPGIAGDPEMPFRRRHRTNGDDDGPDAGRGAGIGLALARRLAEAEGGRLVLSVAQPHPRFSLFLPTGAGEASSEATSTQPLS